MITIGRREEVKAYILEGLQKARERGLEVSQRAPDVRTVQVDQDTQCVQHFTTLIGSDQPAAEVIPMAFMPCEVWRPEPVCPCGQLTVDWES